MLYMSGGDMKHIRYFFIIAGVIMAIQTHAQDRQPIFYEGTETIPYDVVEQITDDIEIRQYPELLAVSATSLDSDNLFSMLFKYITGENTAGQNVERLPGQEVQSVKVAMTTPVAMQQQDGMEKMSFFLPSQYQQDTAPVPTNSSVFLEIFPAKQVATIKFSGYQRKKTMRQKEQELREVIAKHGYKITGAMSAMGYNPPWTLWWLRRNEIMLPVEKIQ
jgi:hypothetical protein